jgi:hypothetical protein
METRLLPVDLLTKDEIKEHFVDIITNHRSTIDDLKDILEYFECNDIEYLTPYEKENRITTYGSLERLHNEIYYLSRLVDYDEIYGNWFEKKCESVFGRESHKQESYIQEYLNDYHNKTYVMNEDVN